MNIAILTHCCAINFGANLQALSTGLYFRNLGHNVIFLNWNEYAERSEYIKHINAEQKKMHYDFLKSFNLQVTEPLSESEEFVNAIIRNNISLLVIGSDAVLTLMYTQKKRIVFSKKGLKVVNNPLDYTYPNPFWVPFYKSIISHCRIVLLSPSCQSTNLRNINKNCQKEIKQTLEHYSLLTARDGYTQKMLSHLLNIPENKIPITPDPVFSLNQNLRGISLPSKDEIISKFNLSDKYFVISSYYALDKFWVQKLTEEANRENYELVALPMPQSNIIESTNKKIALPLNSLDWYCLIKYSSGYIGNNMHPIITCIHNTVPFISLDQHGRSYFRGLIHTSEGSKVQDLLKRLGLESYRYPFWTYNRISPDTIIKKLTTFDYDKCKKAASTMYIKYTNLMQMILNL